MGLNFLYLATLSDVLFSLFLCFSPSHSVESCTGQDLADLGDRLRDWFQLLQGNGKQNNTGNPVASTASSKALMDTYDSVVIIYDITDLIYISLLSF